LEIISNFALRLFCNLVWDYVDDALLITAERIENSGTLWVGVSNSVIGISVHLHKKVFMHFERVGQANASVEGIGMEPAILKKLVELINGKIEFKSALNVSRTFWMELSKPSQESAPLYW
jgi:light-regulated signal transduction histidine kinase (bacteriophytochrome)